MVVDGLSKLGNKHVFSDKTGDVYEFPLKDSTDTSNDEPMSCSDDDAEPRPLLGHLSMLLDMVGFRVICYR